MSRGNNSIITYKELGFGRLELRANDVLCWVPSKDRTTITLEELIIFRDTACELVDGKPKFFLSDNRQLTSLGYSERKFIGNNIHRFARAAAIIENSSVIRYIGHTIQSLFPPKIPMRMFDDETKALEWLKSL